MPDPALGGTPDTAPNETPDGTPHTALNRTRDGMPHTAPEGTPDGAPDRTPGAGTSGRALPRAPLGRESAAPGLRCRGGAAGTAAALALTTALAQLPLSIPLSIPLSNPLSNPLSIPRAGPPAGALRGAEPAAAPIAEAKEAMEAAKAEDCTSPEASLRPSAADGPAVEEIRQRGRLIVGIDQNSYRWGYRRADGELEGFDIDLARAIARDLLGDPEKIIFRAVPTNQRIAALDNGTVDLVVRTMTINCARIEQVAFSTAYFRTGQQVLAPRQSPITGFDESLRGRRVCSAEGSTAYDALEKDAHGALFRDEDDGGPGDRNRLTVPNQLDCLVRLQLGEVDAVVTDAALAAGQAAQDPSVELKGDGPFTTEYYGVAAKLGRDDLVRRVNRVLEQYRAGPWTQAYVTWLKEDLPGIPGPPAPKYRED
ncbi:glutamate ABC transporter substrate-binding protein [Streptomyces pacificus]|uniref:Glutamate ABC transporter substrate-binding protein n=1 Tax=Streptomyces pacificus TaxID=2705029 RepID=A0A6A0AML5_9ACTN|nr:glutamate ABC transporter substrate-binding protein [Streptomyces pacificus]GFH34062.1 glutamate ABC transporter substrate-binding protein [Streptomyces pacificus]